MNIFIIPSWYPNLENPLAGCFIQEQAEAIAEFSSNIVVAVSTWNYDNAVISLRHPFKAINRIYQYINVKKKLKEKNKVAEYYNPVLLWTKKIPFGGIDRLIEINRQNLIRCISDLGKIDIIHAHVCYPAGFIASKLSIEFKIPYVITEHMGPFPFENLIIDGKPIDEIYEAFKFASKAIAVSPSLADRIASFGIRRPVVIPNSVNENIFNLIGFKIPHKFVFLTICGINAIKGIDFLIEAIALWNPNDVEFRIAGDGPMLNTYIQLANSLGIADKVKWLGQVPRDSVPQLFKECSAYVMPSRHETFGIVYAEAIASGKPIIATRCGGPEYIVNKDNGLLVDVGDIRSLVNAMQKIKENISDYDPILIRKDFEERFSRKVVIGKLISLYNEILQ